MKGIEAGMDPEVLHQGLQYLDTGTYNIGLDYYKRLKQEEKRKTLLTEPNLQAFEGLNTPSIDERGQPVPPSEDRLGAARDFYNSVPGLFPDNPELVSQFQTVLNMRAGAAQTGGEVHAARQRAEEASSYRRTDRAAAASRATALYSAQIADEYRQRAEARDAIREQGKTTKEATLAGLASPDPAIAAATITALNEKYGTDAATRIIKDLTLERLGKEAEWSQDRLKGSAGKEEMARLALDAQRQNPFDPKTTALVVSSGVGQLVPNPPPGAPLHVMGTDKDTIRFMDDATKAASLMDNIELAIIDIQNDPNARAALDGIKGARNYQDAMRFLGKQHPSIATLDLNIQKLGFAITAAAKLSPVSNLDVAAGIAQGPLLTEIVNGDGEAALARLREGRRILYQFQYSVYGPDVRDKIQSDIDRILPSLVGEDRAAIDSMRGATGSDRQRRLERVLSRDKGVQSTAPINPSSTVDPVGAEADAFLDQYRRGPGAEPDRR
jgi:hypothetical protein